MGRRENIAKEDRKKAKQKKKEDRKKDIKNEFERVILACEGKVTEKNYFQSIFDNLIENHSIAKTSFVIAKHKHTNPKGVLNDLEEHLKKDSDFEHKWIVIDRDEMRTNGGGHIIQDFNGAISSAKAKNINVAYSNPSFEMWYLLHFEYRNTPIDRDEVVDILEKKIDYTKNSKSVFDKILAQQNYAISNAIRLINHHSQNGRKLDEANDNPSTTVHQLVIYLNCLKK